MSTVTRPRPLRALTLFDLALLLTLALVLLHSLAVESRALAIAMIVAALPPALLPRVREHAVTWLALTAIVGVSVAAAWLWADNHKFLLVYWCLALACGFASARPRRVIARAARLLIGLCFAFAGAWKLLTPDYLDGRAFHYLLLEDARFAPLARWLGADAELRAHNLSLRDAIPEELVEVTLRDAPALHATALALTWWTVLIELAIAALFLRAAWTERPRGPGRAPPARDLALLLFIATTYTLAPVPGFAWLLIAMGLTQTPPGRAGHPARVAYVAALLLTQVYFAIYELTG